MGTWRTHKRAKFHKSGTNYTLVELKSLTDGDKKHFFISIANAYENKDGEMKYKGSVSLPTKHLPKIIKTLTKLEGAIE